MSAPLFFFKAPATTDLYTLSLHDALPILRAFRGQGRWERLAIQYRLAEAAEKPRAGPPKPRLRRAGDPATRDEALADRKSTRLNSSHLGISYAVFCLKKKKTKNKNQSDEQ